MKKFDDIIDDAPMEVRVQFYEIKHNELELQEAVIVHIPDSLGSRYTKNTVLGRIIAHTRFKIREFLYRGLLWVSGIQRGKHRVAARIFPNS